MHVILLFRKQTIHLINIEYNVPDIVLNTWFFYYILHIIIMCVCMWLYNERFGRIYIKLSGLATLRDEED